MTIHRLSSGNLSSIFCDASYDSKGRKFAISYLHFFYRPKSKRQNMKGKQMKQDEICQKRVTSDR